MRLLATAQLRGSPSVHAWFGDCGSVPRKFEITLTALPVGVGNLKPRGGGTWLSYTRPFTRNKAFGVGSRSRGWTEMVSESLKPSPKRAKYPPNQNNRSVASVYHRISNGRNDSPGT